MWLSLCVWKSGCGKAGWRDAIPQVLNLIFFFCKHVCFGMGKVGSNFSLYEKEMGKAAWSDELVAAFEKGKRKGKKGKEKREERTRQGPREGHADMRMLVAARSHFGLKGKAT